MDSCAYFQRIGMDPPLMITKKSLEELFNLQRQTIPFENINLLVDCKIEINPDTWFKKIIENSRGGLCLEVNGLFGHLLKQESFDANYLQCRFLGKDYQISRPYGHLALKVKLDKTYFLDAGYRYAPFRLIPLEFGEYEDELGKVILSQSPVKGIRMERILKGNEKKIPCYDIYPELAELQDFAKELDFIQNNQNSEFKGAIYCSKAIKDGFLYLKRDHVIRWHQGSWEQKPIAYEQLPQILANQFQIQLIDNQYKRLINELTFN